MFNWLFVIFVSFEIKVIELPVKHPELFEALGIDQPKVRFKLLSESQFYKQHVNDKILYTVLLSRKFPTVLDYWGPKANHNATATRRGLRAEMQTANYLSFHLEFNAAHKCCAEVEV